MAAEEQAEIFRKSADAAEDAGLIVAGDVQMSVATRAVMNTGG